MSGTDNVSLNKVSVVGVIDEETETMNSCLSKVICLLVSRA